MTPKLLTVTDDQSVTFELTLEEFLSINEADEECREEVSRLNVGESYTIGGGAMPMYTIKRIQ